jgi:hypothetical protein
MPYRRSTKAPDPKDLVYFFERGIKSLVERFRDHPYIFYTESDMHCYLYYKLYSGLFTDLYKTKDGHDTNLLHKEYSTVARYHRQQDKTLKNDPTGRRRGHFDISIWDPVYINGNYHRKQKVLCAAELALNECSASSVHTINDATKLADHDNEVRYGYLLFFVRDDSSYEKNEAKIWEELSDAARRVRVVFAHVNGNQKPKPKYLGSWGEV